MFCKNCGNRLEDGTKFCPKCGISIDDPLPNAQPLPPQPIIIQAQPQTPNSRPCPKCKGRNVQFQTVTESKKAGCLKVLLYIILAISIFGWLILIPVLTRKKTKTVTYGVCQSCGYRWKA